MLLLFAESCAIRSHRYLLVVQRFVDTLMWSEFLIHPPVRATLYT